MVAKVIQGGGEPVNEAERLAIRYLRDNLPDGYLLMHNFEIQRGRELFEVDLAIFAPHAIYLVDVKGTRGLIDVYGSKWYPQGRQPFTSPLPKLRGHAKTLKGIILDGNPGRPELRCIYVDATILLTHETVSLKDPQDRDSASVTTLAEAKRFFCDSSRIPQRMSSNIREHFPLIGKALLGSAKPRTGPQRFGNWEVCERLGGGEGYTEYRAINIFAGKKAGTVMIKAYEADPYLPDVDRSKQLRFIANGFRALNALPTHPGIAGCRDFFANEDESRYYLVTDDMPGQALRLYLDKPNLALTLNQKFRIAKDIFAALNHAHAHGVVHRNLTPGTLLIDKSGRVRLVGFDFARSGSSRSDTIASELNGSLDNEWQAPEVYSDAASASPESDVFSSGLILYELFTGEQAFSSRTELFDQSCEFSQQPSQLSADLPDGFDSWLQSLCQLKPEQRPSSQQALQSLKRLLEPEEESAEQSESPSKTVTTLDETPAAPVELDFSNLKQGETLNRKFVVQSKLGRGQFGVVYKVIDTLGDVTRAVKLILNDRHSTLERLKKEYRLLLRLPEHPYVVKVIDADFLHPGNVPYLVFEYLEGQDVGDMCDKKAFSPEDVLAMAKQIVEGLAHLHSNDVYHCDIKPGNLLWTRKGVKIIDFNVSVDAAKELKQGGGTRRYIAPDIDLDVPPQSSDLADRDLYALGITLYQILTGRYPWEAAAPPPGVQAKDPRELNGFADIAPEMTALLLKAINPRRAERFTSCVELMAALKPIKQARRSTATNSSTDWTSTDLGSGTPQNGNPYVDHLLTLYSQSPHSNGGTRGLDAFAQKLYVETGLDRELLPAVLNGEFKLVLITGNAGDGKTAFLQMLEAEAEKRKANFETPLINGKRFKLGQQCFLTNYDGSQDEGEQDNKQVLDHFFEPFIGSDPANWMPGETRLIAINEGRLVDYLTTEESRFDTLRTLALRGLESGEASDGVVVVNLNQRSVTATVDSAQGKHSSIFRRLVGRMTQPKLWQPCEACSIKDKCYAYHNAKTFQDETAGPKVIDRLEAIYELHQMRDRHHITLRDLRSALAFMLVGTRNCDEIKALYTQGDREQIVQSYYFNSWMGGDLPNQDRLLSQLKTVDVASMSDPSLDRALDFVTPVKSQAHFGFEKRTSYDLDVLSKLYGDLPRDYNGKASQHRFAAHQRFVSLTKRKHFFERRDENWRSMLPYISAFNMKQLMDKELALDAALNDVLYAINRGEGLTDAHRLGDNLALQVRQVDKGTVRSYRLFAADKFSLAIRYSGEQNRFLEHQPQGLVLQYVGDSGMKAELILNLDVFEMLMRLNEGYRPNVEELQGYYLNLSIFKNLLNSEPYQEVLLTTTGHDFYQVKRASDGCLGLSVLGEDVA